MLLTVPHCRIISKSTQSVSRLFFDLFRFQAFSTRGTKLSRRKAAIVITCPTLQNHFKVNAVGQPFLSIFFRFQAFSTRGTKLSKEKAAIVINCPTLQNYFHTFSQRTRSADFLKIFFVFKRLVRATQN